MDLHSSLTQHSDGSPRKLTSLERRLAESKPVMITGQRLKTFLPVMRLGHTVGVALRDPGLFKRMPPEQTLSLDLRKVVDYYLRVANRDLLASSMRIAWIAPAHNLETIVSANAYLLRSCEINLGPWLMLQTVRMFTSDPENAFDEVRVLCALFAPIAAGEVTLDDFLP